MGIYGRKKSAVEFCRAKCRECKNIDIVDRLDFRHASPPRCSSCGGMLDKCGKTPLTPATAIRRVLRGKKKTRKQRREDRRVVAEREQEVLAKTMGLVPSSL